MNLFGSICLSDIPREQMKKVMCKDGVERIYVNVFIGDLQTHNPQPSAPTPEEVASAPTVDCSDLPF